MDHEIELKIKIQASNILELSRETNVSRSVIYNFLKGRSMSSQNLFTLMRYFQNKNLKIDSKKKHDFDVLLDMIIKTMNPEKIILFGSQARGDWNEHSDFDIAIIDAEKRNPELHSQAGDLSISFDYFVLTSSRLFSNTDGLLDSIIKDGVVVYEKRERASG